MPSQQFSAISCHEQVTFDEMMMMMKLVFVASPLSTQHLGERADCLGVRITCPK
jgi:hypothetical protein